MTEPFGHEKLIVYPKAGFARSLPLLKFGTCSWKYDAGRGIVCSDARVPNPHFLSVERLERVMECLEPMLKGSQWWA